MVVFTEPLTLSEKLPKFLVAWSSEIILEVAILVAEDKATIKKALLVLAEV